jgi:hypothetical protein
VFISVLKPNLQLLPEPVLAVAVLLPAVATSSINLTAPITTPTRLADSPLFPIYPNKLISSQTLLSPKLEASASTFNA